MSDIRVVVVDDSAVIRRLLREVLSSDSAFEIAGIAGDGATGLSRIEQVSPDVVTLDVELPDERTRDAAGDPQALAEAASENFLNQDKVNLSSQENALVGVDPAVAATNLAQSQTAYEENLAATSRLLNLPHLLDFLV